MKISHYVSILLLGAVVLLAGGCNNEDALREKISVDGLRVLSVEQMKDLSAGTIRFKVTVPSVVMSTPDNYDSGVLVIQDDTDPRSGIRIKGAGSHAFGEKVTVRDQYKKTGYNVTPWSASDAAVSSGSFTMPAKDVTFTSNATQIMLTATWKNWDGSTIATTKVPYGSVPQYDGTAPSKASDSQYSYTFKGWSPEPAAITSNATYNAEFTPIKIVAKTYTITWKNWDGSTLASTTVEENNTPAYPGTAPARPTDAQYNYTFKGWSPTIAKATSNATYTATYSSTPAEHNVIYKVNDSVIGTEAHAYGTTVTVRGDYAKEGFTVTSWTTVDAAVSGKTFTMPAKDVTFTAKTSPMQLTITWKNWDGSTLSTTKVQYGTVPEYAGSVPTRASDSQYSYTFKGWTPAIVAATSNTTYTATYDSSAAAHTVRYLVDGVPTGSTEAHAYGDTVAVRSQYVKTGYSVTPWSTGDVAVSGGRFTMPAKDVTFTATTAPLKFTITWKDWDGSTLSTTKVQYNETPAFDKATPARPATSQYSYTFKGWSPAIAKAAADATYTATYDRAAMQYAVRYMVDGEQAGNAETHSFGESVSVRDQYSKTGYTATPWSTGDATVSGGSFVMPDKDVTFTATTSQIMLTATWKNWNGSTITTTKVPYGSVPAYSGSTPTKAADSSFTYSFSGWSPAPAAMTSNATYTAQFESIPIVAKTFTITWKDWNGSTLASTTVEEGKMPTFPGGEPVRTSDSMYSYSFKQWDQPVVKAAANATYKAVYDRTPIDYHVTYLVDGTSVFTDTHAYGTTVAVRDAFTKEGYVVSGWKAPSGVTVSGGTFTMPSKNVTFTATSSPTQVQILWKNWDGKQLARSTVDYGKMPFYTGAEPTKPSDDVYEYRFEGWSPALTEAKGDTSYTATFTQRLITTEYTIIWKNWDDSVLSQSSARHGTMPSYYGPTPAKEADAQYTYSFKGWSPAPTAAKSNATYTAQFNSIPVVAKTYEITWKNWDDSVLARTTVQEGTVPDYPGITPVRPDDSQSTYTFGGWSPAPASARSDATYIAQYTASPIAPSTYTITWKNWDDSLLSTTTVKEGEVPVYQGSTPTRPSDSQGRYAFKGWDPTPVAATVEATYKAVFELEPEKHVTGVALDKRSVSLKAGDSARLAATVSPSDASDRSVTWSSSDASVAKVDQNGIVTGVSEVKATITVKTVDGGFASTCEVSVTPEPEKSQDSTWMWIVAAAAIIAIAAAAALLLKRRSP